MTVQEPYTRAKEIESTLQIAYELRVSNLEQSIALTSSAIEVASEAKLEALVAKGNNRLGLYCMILGKFDEAAGYSEKALAYFEKVQDLAGIADAKYNIAGVHYKTDNFHLGFQYLLDCIAIYQELDDPYNESRALKSIGTIYEWFGDIDNAVAAYRRATEMAKLVNDLNLESNAYNPLSGIYLKQGKLDLALSTIEKSISIKEKTQDIRGLAFALYGRGKVFLKLNKIDQALRDFEECLRIQLLMGDKLGLTMVYNKLGVLFLESGDYDNARLNLQKAWHTADTYNIAFIRYKSLYHLHLVARREGKLEEALDFLDRYTKLKEETINGYTYNVIKSYKVLARVKDLEKEAEAQRDQTEIIERKNAELDSFFYRVSHDLRGPISSLLGLHNLVKHEITDTAARRYFDMYQSQILRINSIVLDLINLTRMNNAEDNKVKINFHALLNDCINAYQYLENFPRIQFIREVDAEIEFASEWAIINTILQNLIENAIKYAQVGNDPFVKISITKSENALHIQVADNGMGIDPAFQSQVFNMFFRANDRIQGTGLGLYILKRAVERLQGTVDFKSQLHVGTVFYVTLPV
jgi:signal transduction histidine kinase